MNFASAGIWGSLASWEDAKGTRWVLTPIWGAKHSQFKAPIENGAVKDGAIVAFKVEEKGGKLQLTPGLDFARHESRRAARHRQRRGVRVRQRRGYRAGVSRRGSGRRGRRAAFPAPPSAVLYALDAQTGKELWSSGDQIASWNHWTGLSIANGRVYIGTYR